MVDKVNSEDRAKSLLQNEDKENRNRNKDRYSWFACVLYLDESKKHVAVFESIKRMCGVFPEYVYIDHDPDDISRTDMLIKDNDFSLIYDEIKNPDLNLVMPKKHTHLMFKTCDQRSIDGVLSKFVGWSTYDGDNGFVPYLYYVKGIVKPMDYLEYMIHRDHKSITLGKTAYTPYDFKGESKIICKLAKRNLYFVSNAKQILLSWLADNKFADFVGFEKYVLEMRYYNPIDYFILEEFISTHSYEIKSIIHEYMWG